MGPKAAVGAPVAPEPAFGILNRAARVSRPPPLPSLPSGRTVGEGWAGCARGGLWVGSAARSSLCADAVARAVRSVARSFLSLGLKNEDGREGCDWSGGGRRGGGDRLYQGLCRRAAARRRFRRGRAHIQSAWTVSTEGRIHGSYLRSVRHRRICNHNGAQMHYPTATGAKRFSC